MPFVYYKLRADAVLCPVASPGANQQKSTAWQQASSRLGSLFCKTGWQIIGTGKDRDSGIGEVLTPRKVDLLVKAADIELELSQGSEVGKNPEVRPQRALRSRQMDCTDRTSPGAE